MRISTVSTQQGITQRREFENKPKAQEQKEVSFWSKDWTAGNFIREKIGWDGLADWLDDKDKVCTDGKDDGKLSFGETMESFGKGLAGLVKGAVNHPIATAVTVGVGAAAVALTGGAILPVMVAAGATMGAGMIGVGAYKATKADNDADAKRAWETIGTGTFTAGASLVGAKTSLNQANKAGVISAKGAKDMSAGKALVQNFKSIPESLKQSCLNSKGNIHTWLSAITGENVIYQNSNKIHNLKMKECTTYDQRHPEAGYDIYEYTEVPAGTKIETYGTVKTVKEGELLFKNGNNYSLRTPQSGYTINNNNRIAYALDNEIIIGDDGNTIINGAKQAMQRAQDLKTASAMQLDKELASQGIKLIGREENSTYSLLDDIIVEVNGTVKRLETKAYFSDITMYKEALLEWIKNGNSYVFKGELY